MRIGIFGGTFNPVHLGHTALASYICNLGLVDEVWLMVSPQNPFKRDQELLDEEIRLHMAALAVKDFPRLRASDFEFRLPRPSYTWVTLQELEKAYPDDTFSLIIGGDNWEKFSAWRNSADILACYPVIVYPREKSEGNSTEQRFCPPITGKSKGAQRLLKQSEPASAADVHFLDSAPLYFVSSTDIRNAIAAGEDVAPWLDPTVHKFIRQHELYK